MSPMYDPPESFPNVAGYLRKLDLRVRGRRITMATPPPPEPDSRWHLKTGVHTSDVNVYYKHDELGDTLVGTLYLGPDETEDLRERLS